MNGLSRGASAVAGVWWRTMLIFLVATGCAGRHFGVASAGPQGANWATALSGAWAFVDVPSAGTPNVRSAPRDTAVWHLDPGGKLRRTKVVVRVRGDNAVVKERDTGVAWWWVESKVRNDPTARMLCTSARPSRNRRQCGRVRIDTLAGFDGRPTRRLTWSGVTFKSQHWTLVERASVAR